MRLGVVTMEAMVPVTDVEEEVKTNPFIIQTEECEFHDPADQRFRPIAQVG